MSRKDMRGDIVFAARTPESAENFEPRVRVTGTVLSDTTSTIVNMVPRPTPRRSVVRLHRSYDVANGFHRHGNLILSVLVQTTRRAFVSSRLL